MNVVPLRPNVRHYCGECDVHYFQHEQTQHRECSRIEWCSSCGRALQQGETECPMCQPEHAA